MAKASATLIFPPTSTKVGKPYSIAENWEVSPRRACRELIQNALDAHAAVPEKLNEPCRVIFKTKRISAAEIPAIDTYRKVLAAGQESWKDNRSVKNYLASLHEYSKQSQLEVLYISDNGIGFKQKTLAAILAEGTPEKQAGSSGSFGIGHLTAFGLSGLQYIFYGSKSASGELFCAGHAILSSHKDPDTKKHHANHGYFLSNYTPDFEQPYVFCDEADIPPFMVKQLEAVENSGSVIAVIGFKGFGNNEDDDHNVKGLTEIICEAVAENFAIAICDNTLAVEVHDGTDVRTIDQSRIVEFLTWMAKPETGTKERTREAQLTLEAIESFSGSDHTDRLPGKFQDCQIFLRNITRSHSVSIWRNGMLITRKHRGLSKSMFDDKKPLNAVITLSGQEDKLVAHDLIKMAENPMHDRIEEKRLASKKEKQELKSFFSAARDWIKEHAADSGGQFLDLDDEILLDTGDAGISKVERGIRLLRIPEDPDDEDLSADPDASGGTRPDPNPKPKPKSRITRKNVAKAKMQGRIDDHQYLMHIVPNENIKQAILQLSKDNGQDPSCSHFMADAILELNKATISGDPKRNLTVDVESRTVSLGDLRKDVPVIVELLFNEPLDKVSLNCQLGSLHQL